MALTIITILTAAALSAGVCAVFRALDRDNNGVDKVNRFLKARQESIDNHFKELQDNLVAARAETQTARQQAVATIKNLDAKRESFEEEARRVSGYADTVQKIESKINGYEKTLDELSEMTASAEENLNRLSKESIVVGRLDKALAAQKKNVEAVEKKVAQVSDGFAATNAEQLKTLGDALLEEYEKRRDELARQVDETKAKADESLEHLRGEIAGIYEEAARKADALEDSAFEHLSEKAQKRSDEYKRESAGKIQSLQDELEKRLAGASAQVEGHAAEVERKISEIEGGVQAKCQERCDEMFARFEEDCDSRAKELDARFLERYKEFAQKYSKRAEDADAAIKSKYVSLQQKYGEQTSKVDAQLAQKYVSLAQKYEQKAKELDSLFDQKTGEMSAQFKSTSATVVANIKNTLTSLDEKSKAHADSLGKKYSDRIEALRAKYDSLLDSMQSKYDGGFDSLQASLTQKAQAIEEQSAQVKTMYDEQETSIINALTERLKSIDESYGERLRDTQSRLDEALAKARETSESVQGCADESKSALSSLKESLDAQIKEIQNECGALYAEAANDAARKEEEAISLHAQKSAEAIESYRSQIQSQIDEIQKAMDDTLGRAKEAKEFVAQNSSESAEIINSVKESLDAQIKEIESRYDGLYDSAMAKAKEESEEKLSAQSAEIQRTLEGMARDAQEKLDAQISAMNQAADEASAKIETARNESLDSSRALDALKDSFESKVGEIKNFCADLYDSAMAKAKEESEEKLSAQSAEIQRTLEGMARDAQEKLDAQISAMNQAADEASAKIETARNESLDSSRALDALKDSFETKVGEIKSLCDDLHERAMESARNDENEKLAAHTAEIDDAIDSFRRDADARLDAAVEALEKSLDDAKENAAAISRGVDENTQKLDELNRTLDERAAKIRESGAQEFDAALVEAKHDSQRKIDEFVGELGETIERFRQSVQEQVDGAQTDLDKSLAKSKISAEELSRAVDENERKLGALKASLDGKMDELDAKYSDVCANISSRIGEQERKILGESSEKILSDLERYENSTREKIDALKTSMAESLANVSREAQTSLDETRAAIARLEDECASAKDAAGSMGPDTDEKIEAVNARIESFRAGAESRLKELESSLGESARDVSAQYEAKRSDVLRALDEELNSYRSDFEYKFSRLKESQKDVDSLEESLRGAMGQARERTLKDFEAFADAQKQKYDGFVSSIKDESAKLESRLQTLEGGVENLKQTAASNVSDKLKAFEDKIGADLGERGDKLIEEIARWKSGFDARLSGISAEYEKSRESVEKEYSDGLREKFAAVQSEADERVGKIMESASEAKESADVQIASIKESIDALSREMQEKVGRSQDETDDFLKKSVAEYMEKINTSLGQTKALVVSDLKEFERSAKEREDASGAVMRQAEEKIVGFMDSVNKKIAETDELAERLKNQCDVARRLAGSIEPEIDEKVGAAENKIEKFRAQTDEKLRALEGSLEDLFKKTYDECEKRQTDALKSLDGELSEYRKEFEYQADRLQSSEKDIGILESSLREAMEQVGAKVLKDFDAFTDGQRKKYDEFASSFKSNSDSLDAKVNALDGAIDALKETAMGNVNARLKDFEDTVTGELKSKEDAVSENVNSWKSALDGKVELFVSDYEKARRDIEIKYADSLKAKLEEIAGKNDEQLSKAQLEVSGARRDVDEKISAMQVEVDSFMAGVRSKIDESRGGIDEYLKQTSSDYLQKINDRLDKMRADLSESFSAFEESMADKQATSSAGIDAALSEFNAWKTQFNQQLDQFKSSAKEQLDVSQSAVDGQLEKFKSSAQEKIESVKSALDGEIERRAQETRAKGEAIDAKFDELKARADSSLSDYESRSAEMLAELQRRYDEMLKETEENARRQNADAERRLADLRERIKSVEVSNSESQADFVLKMQNNSNDIQSRMSELNAGIQNIKAQMQLYEKAGQMKKQLDEKLSELDGDFTRIDEYKDTAAKLMAQYKDVCAMSDEMSARAAEFSERKDVIDAIGKKYDEALRLAGSVDEKIDGMNKTSDKIQEMEISTRDFQEKLNGISSAYERLERKKEVLERVSRDVDSTFDRLKQIENGLKDCQRDVKSLPNEIKNTQDDVDRILKDSPRVFDAASKLSSLQDILSELEQRTASLMSAREGIGKTEVRLRQMQNDIDKQFSLLRKLVQRDIDKNPVKREDGLTPQDMEDMRRLKLSGWDVEDIARTMGRTVTEVNMVLDMPPPSEGE